MIDKIYDLPVIIYPLSDLTLSLFVPNGDEQ